jgi:putative hydrolase of HD superfamily
MMAWVLGEAAGLDTARLVKLVLVHDLPESEVGDLTPYGEALGAADLARKVPRWREMVSADQLAAARRSKRRLEANAAARLWGLLPRPLSAEMADLWRDYAARTTPEARFAAQIDKLEALLQAIEYWEAGHPSDVENFLVTARETVEHPVLLALLKELEEKAGTQVSEDPS